MSSQYSLHTHIYIYTGREREIDMYVIMHATYLAYVFQLFHPHHSASLPAGGAHAQSFVLSCSAEHAVIHFFPLSCSDCVQPCGTSAQHITAALSIHLILSRGIPAEPTSPSL